MTPLMKAYADCWLRDYNEGLIARDLNYRDNLWLTLSEWEVAMAEATPNGYNDFEAHEIANKLKALLNDKIECITIQGAREGSVACYIKAEQSLLKKLAEQIRKIHLADEIDIVNNELRLWWD